MYSILYVDDERALLEITKLFLEMHNEFRVDIKISAREALEALRSTRYDAVISDYQMPEMDGIAFLKEVRASYGNLPFILFTGKGREEIVIEAIDNGVDFYLQKGGDPRAQFAELAHKIKKAVENRRMTEALRKNEERLRFALEGANDGIWDVNLTTGEFYISPRGAGIIGYTPEEILTTANIWTDLVNPDDMPATMAALDAYIEGKTTVFSIEQRLKTKSGEWKWVLSRGKAVGRDENGRPVRMTGTHTDITERKLAGDRLRLAYEKIASAEEELRAQYDELKLSHDELRRSEECLRRAEMVARIGHWEFHLDTGNVVASPGSKAMYGLDDGEWSIPQVQKIPLPEYRARLDAALKALVEEGTEYDVEFRIRCPTDGATRDIHSLAEYDRERHVVFGVMQDVTESRRTEKEKRAMYEQLAAAEEELRSQYETLAESRNALAESEKNYRGIIENTQDVFYRTDRKGILVLISPSGALLLGYPDTSEMVGRPATDFYGDPSQRELLLSSLKEDGTVSNVETTLKRRDGSLVIVSTSSHTLHDPDGNFDGVEGIFHDITARKQMEDTLRATEEQYRVLLDHSLDGIFLIQDGILLISNNAFATMLGYTIGEITGMHITSIVAPEDCDMVMERYRARLEGKPVPDPYSFRMLKKDGTTRVPVMASVGVGTYRNRPASIGTVRDMSRRHDCRCGD